MHAALAAAAGAARVAAQASAWADGRWHDVSPYFNLPITICKTLPNCVQEGKCELGHGSCPTRFEEFEGYCYRVISRPSVFEQAVARCKERDATLVSITSPEENNFVQNLCGNHFCWLGLAEEPGGETWYWIDGSFSPDGADGYWNWAKGEPNNAYGLDETVAVMNFNLPEAEDKDADMWANGLWYDVPRSFSLGQAICEQAAAKEQQCPDEWALFERSCYRFHHWPANFEEAEARCKESSAHLVSIGSDEEQYFVQRLCGKNMCWLGLSEKRGSEYWDWLDGTDLRYENWAQGEPNNFGGDESRACMNFHFREVIRKAPVAWKMSQRRKSLATRMKAEKDAEALSLGLERWADGTWYDAPVTFNLPISICKCPAACLTSVEGCGNVQEPCDGGWQAFKNYCYLRIDRPSEFNIALHRCEEHNAFLISIETAEENEFVQKLCGNRFCWLGLRKHTNSAVWWWLDGRAYDSKSFSNWHIGEPNNFDNADENVAMMNFDMKELSTEETKPGAWATGEWYDVMGNLDLPTAICENQRGQSFDSCPSGWQSFQWSCYKRLDWHWDFHTASERCEEMEAHLVSIATVEEQEFVQQLCGARMCWLGLSEHPQTEVWHWWDNTPLAYQNWARGEPNNWHGHDENCAVMNMHSQFSARKASDEEDLASALVCGLVLLGVILLGRVLLQRWQAKQIERIPILSDGARSPVLLETVLEGDHEEEAGPAE